MKISVIGAGNVGSLTAMRLAEAQLGEIALIDIVSGLSRGKAFDLEDCRFLLNVNYKIEGTEDFTLLAGSDIVVITAGLARKPGMTREDLISKNSQILKSICQKIKEYCPQAILVIVTNPLDLMTHLAIKETGFPEKRVIGMGLGLDASRFANLIAQELNVPIETIEPCVIGSHGEGMLPLSRHTNVNGKALEQLVSKEKCLELIKGTINRGAQIVAQLGTGSAFFAPSLAAFTLVKAIAKDEKKTIGVCALVNGEYGIKGTCIGVPCCIGKGGIEKIIELDLSEEEKQALLNCAASLRATAEKYF